jgi:5-methylcytosine-specific restriction enzyme subunit McrC
MASKHLCLHESKGFFRLQPDLVMTRANEIWVLDTKWKVLSGSTAVDDGLGRSRYGLSQSDFYQLFAYGHKYLNGIGDLFLVYPQTKTFIEALPPFQFADGLTLWVVPFDLDRDVLVAAPGGLPLRLGTNETTNSEAEENSGELSTV